MNTFELLGTRKSIRQFTGELPSDEEMQRILYAGMAAPVVMADYRNFNLTVLTSKELLDQIDEAGFKLFNSPNMPHPLYGTPMLILVSARIYPGREAAMYASAGYVVYNMHLAATELGLGSVIIWASIQAMLREQSILDALNLPKDFIPCCSLAVGQTDAEFALRDIPMNRIPIDYIG